MPSTPNTTTRAPEVVTGMTCRIGKGKTLWEVVDVRPVQSQAPEAPLLELSALGKNGYSNRSIRADEAADLRPRQLHWTLGEVLRTRSALRGLAMTLTDRARFTNLDEIVDLGMKVATAAEVYARAVESHRVELAERYGIEADQ